MPTDLPSPRDIDAALTVIATELAGIDTALAADHDATTCHPDHHW
jgi:hypothetical protein